MTTSGTDEPDSGPGSSDPEATAPGPGSTAPEPSDPGQPGPPSTDKPPLDVTVPTSPSTTPGPSGPVAPKRLVDDAVADLSKRAGVSAETITVAVDEAVDWKDGSIGCPRQGMMYPMVVTPGYRLILEAEGKQYAYHAARGEAFFYCPKPDPAGTLRGGTTSS